MICHETAHPCSTRLNCAALLLHSAHAPGHVFMTAQADTRSSNVSCPARSRAHWKSSPMRLTARPT